MKLACYGERWPVVHIPKSAKQTSGFKAWKDGLTLILCDNAAGDMAKPAAMYRAKNPHALKNKNKTFLAVCLEYNKKAWMTAMLYTERI